MIDLFLYFLLGLVIIGFELGRKRYFIIDHITLFNFFFFLVYSFTPIMLLLEGTHLINDDMPYGHEYFGYNPFTSIIVFSAYLFFLAGYNAVMIQKQKYILTFQTGFNTDFTVKILPFIYTILFALLYVYTNEFGGLKETIEQAEAYRSSMIKPKQFGFVQHFFPLNTILLYYAYFKVVLQKNQNHRAVMILFLLMSILISLLIMAIYNSRGYIIFEVAGLYIITSMYHKNYFFKYLIPSLIVAFLVIKFGRPFFNSISDLIKYGFDTFWDKFTGNLEILEQEGGSIIPNFTHPIVSLEASLARSGIDIELRYFKDIFYAFYSLLPNELLGIKDPQRLMELNTIVLQGRELTQILPGILGFFSYSLHVVGVFIGSFVYGLFGGYLNKIFAAFYSETKASLVYIYLISLTYGYFVFRGAPINAVLEKFILMVVLFAIFFYSKITIKKKSSASI